VATEEVSMLERILQTRDDRATFSFAIGLPWPDVPGLLVGVVETVCGAAIILGLLTRLAVIPLMIVLIVASLSTKVPILLGHDFLIFNFPHINRYGFWSMQHEARAGLCMLLASLYLLFAGNGACSIDVRLQARSPA